jgi:hypothetical protein
MLADPPAKEHSVPSIRLARPALWLLALWSASASAQHHAAAGDTPPAAIPARVEIALADGPWRSLPRESVRASAHGQSLDCSGVPLLAVLRQAGAMPADPLRGAQLARRVEVRARDGYQVTFSLAELDPTLGNRRVFLVDQCSGKPLDQDSGPLRLIVPEDARPARGIRQIETIVVLSP